MNNKTGALVRVLLSLALTLSILGAFFLSAAGETTEAKTLVNVKQTVENDPKETNFSYALIAKDTENPMPEGTENGTFLFSLNGNNSQSIALSYDVPGNYEYRLGMVKSIAKDGTVTLDDSVAVHDFGMLVKQRSDGSLEITPYTCYSNELVIHEQGVQVIYTICGVAVDQPTTKVSGSGTKTVQSRTTTQAATRIYEAQTTVRGGRVNTGDPNNLILWVTIAAVALLAMGGMFFMVLRKHKDDDDEENDQY